MYVAPGSFQMGSSETRATEKPSEKPVHTVTLSKGFWLGKYEVIQTEYEALSSANPSGFRGPRQPVEQTSWSNAVAFCTELTERERAAGRLPAGYEYRLPTEAEWEYAARGGTGSKGYTFAGSNQADEVAWYGANSSVATHPVGLKQPNELGLYDMSGNVWEWCLDWCDWDYDAKSPALDPVNLQATTFRVSRGGGCYCVAGDVRSACRFWFWPGYVGISLGFRACLAPRIEGQ